MKILNFFLKKANLSVNRRKVVSNVYWAVLGKVVNIISGLLVGIMVARYLGPDQFGLMNYVISYVTLFSILASFGLDNIEVRELARNPQQRDAIMGTSFLLRLGFAVATMGLISLTLWRFESDRYTVAMVLVYSVMLVLSSLNVIRNYFTSIILNEYVVKTEISRTVVGALIKVVLLLFHCSLTWFIVASAFDFFLVAGGFLYAYRKKVGSVRAWLFNRAIAKMLIVEAFPLMLSGAAVIIYQKINAVMIRNMMDNASVGQFSVASKIIELGIFVPMVIAQTVTPLLVKAHKDDPVRYRVKRQQFMDIMVWSAIVMATGICLLADPVIRFLYGDQYAAAIPVLQIMAWKTVLMALFSGSGQIILVEGLQRYVAIRNFIGCAVSVGLNYLLIPVWGIFGSAVATVATMLVAGYLAHLVIRPYIFLFPLQSSAIFFGWRRIITSGLKMRTAQT